MPMKQGYKFMSLFLIIVGASVMYLLAGKFYAPIIGKVLQEKSDRKTSTVRIDDGRASLTGYRQLCGGYHNRKDFESLVRTN